MRIANMYEQRMVFVWAQGSEISEVFPASDGWEKTGVIDIIDAREAAYTYALEKLVAHLEYETAFILNPAGHALAEPAGEPRNPYKGLRAFTTDEAVDFFGRDALVHELLEELGTIVTSESPTEPASRLLAVIGPSGSGKSSVMMAGLLPQLQTGALPGSLTVTN
jgi:hypothetical protein